MSAGRTLYRTIVGYALALVTTVETGALVGCTRPPREGHHSVKPKLAPPAPQSDAGVDATEQK